MIGKVAKHDLHKGEWADLVPTLLNNMGEESRSGVKQATMNSLGYICEETAHQAFEQHFVDRVLTAVVRGMQAKQEGSEQADMDVRVAATEALQNAMEFATENFKRENERNYIMQVVCEGTLSPDPRVRHASYECLVTIATHYYEHLQVYMKDIFDLTCRTVRYDEESVALQAIEFWSTVAEEEAERLELIEDGDTSIVLHNFIPQALNTLAPLLLETLTKQADPEEDDPDVWNIAMAGGTCLQLVANVAKDGIVPLVMPYVQENVNKQNWREREAATYAFGSILEGPDPSKLESALSQALPIMIQLLKDGNVQVRDTAAWTLSRLFSFAQGRHGPGAGLADSSTLAGVLHGLLESLNSNDETKVMEKVCYAMHCLITAFDSYANSNEESLPITNYFTNIAQTLLRVSERGDAATSKIRSNAFEALNELVRVSSADCEGLILQLLPVVIQKLHSVVNLDASQLSEEHRTQLFEMQGTLCGCLQVIIQKLGSSSSRESLLNFSDTLMDLFVRVLSFKSSTVLEEAFLAIGSLAHAAGNMFITYMDALYPHLEAGLQNHSHHSVCQVAVGLVGDLCRALESKMEPYCDRIVTVLLQDISSRELNMRVKPSIISCMGDIALAIGPSFERYVGVVAKMLLEAAQTCIQTSRQASHARDDMLETNNELKKAIFEAFSGILMGFKDHDAQLKKFGEDSMDPILSFLNEVAKDDLDDESLSAYLNLLGDIFETVPSSARKHLNNKEGISNLIKHIPEDRDATVSEAANRAKTYAELSGD